MNPVNCGQHGKGRGPTDTTVAFISSGQPITFCLHSRSSLQTFNLAPNPFIVQELTGPRDEPITISLLNGHGTKLPSLYLYLFTSRQVPALRPHHVVNIETHRWSKHREQVSVHRLATDRTPVPPLPPSPCHNKAQGTIVKEGEERPRT